MSAGLIVIYVTQPDRTLIGGAQIWITQMSGTGIGNELEFKVAGDYKVPTQRDAKTYSHGFLICILLGLDRTSAKPLGRVASWI